ncbi:hypothetical protein EDD17DRAFT_734841 [Pisolithus thermaeus]|nr:hypothetical protein EV401DRAFT_1511020 [Pisolithus croceorrhizus]KAI6160912.1 hypothetical protein EDD17DRAFT_734841 [Pisolithus thermaeus]
MMWHTGRIADSLSSESRSSKFADATLVRVISNPLRLPLPGSICASECVSPVQAPWMKGRNCCSKQHLYISSVLLLLACALAQPGGQGSISVPYCSLHRTDEEMQLLEVHAVTLPWRADRYAVAIHWRLELQNWRTSNSRMTEDRTEMRTGELWE